MQSTANTLLGGTERRLALASFAAVSALIALFLLRDASAFVNSADDELVGHLGASAGFTIAAAGALLTLRQRRPHTLEIMGAGVAITVALELTQGLVPNRGIELGDIAVGLAGVLLATFVIELLLLLLAYLAALRVHVAFATAGSLVLLTLLVVDLAPESIGSVARDGDSCPPTALLDERVRIELGADLQLTNGCLVQDGIGALALLGPDTETSLTVGTVLVSSRLDPLVDSVRLNGRIILRSQVTTSDFDPSDSPQTAVIASLPVHRNGNLLQLRIRGSRIEALGPSVGASQRSFVYPTSLEPNTRYVVELELLPTEIRVLLDGELIAQSVISPDWLDGLRSIDDPTLQLLIGNSEARTLPFDGVIEWVEIET